MSRFFNKAVGADATAAGGCVAATDLTMDLGEQRAAKAAQLRVQASAAALLCRDTGGLPQTLLTAACGGSARFEEVSCGFSCPLTGAFLWVGAALLGACLRRGCPGRGERGGLDSKPGLQRP